MIQSVRAWDLLISLGVVAGSLHAASPLPVKPNIPLMVGDDIGWGDIGCYGSPQIKTPNIDRMAQEGTRFTSGYVTAALCSPSRAAPLPGRYQQRNGLENNRLAEPRRLYRPSLPRPSRSRQNLTAIVET